MRLLITGSLITAVVAVIQYRVEGSVSWEYTKWILVLFAVLAAFDAWRSERPNAVKDPKLDGWIVYGQEIHDSDEADGLRWSQWLDRYEGWRDGTEAYLKGLNDPVYERFVKVPYPEGARNLTLTQQAKLKLGLQLCILRDYRDKVKYFTGRTNKAGAI